MNVHILQHVAFEGPGSIADWCAARNARITTTRLYDGDALPNVDPLDLLIVLGGPMSVHDEPALPWLRAEKRFLASALEKGKAVLGICLGAQLLAHVGGARVYANPEREIGWFDIERAPEAVGPFGFPQRLTVFHWHGETFDIPSGARRLARSEACENQAFAWGDRVIGLQFHLETTPRSAEMLIEHARVDLRPGRYVQSEADLLATPPHRYAAINDEMKRVLDQLAAVSPR